MYQAMHVTSNPPMRPSPFNNAAEHGLSWHWLSKQSVNEKQANKPASVKYGKPF